MMTELAGCPHCGAQPPTVEVQIESDAYSVFCNGCGAMINWDNSKAEVVGAWNERTAPAPAIPTEVAYTTRKALERYKNRILEVEMMGWYSSATVTTDEIIRIDAALAWLDSLKPQE